MTKNITINIYNAINKKYITIRKIGRIKREV